MGAGPTWQNPKYFWAPTGGWNNTPANYRTNAAIVLGGVVAVAALSVVFDRKVVYEPAKVESQETVDRWNAAAGVRNKYIQEHGLVNVNVLDR